MAIQTILCLLLGCHLFADDTFKPNEMRKLLFLFLLLPWVCEGQLDYHKWQSQPQHHATDTSTATKEETIEWITSKLKKCTWSKEDNITGIVKSNKIETTGSIVHYITEYYSTSGEIQIITDSFDLTDIQGISLLEGNLNLYCRENNCIAHTDNLKGDIIEYYNVCIVEHCSFDNAMVERLKYALEHLKRLVNAKEKF